MNIQGLTRAARTNLPILVSVLRPCSPTLEGGNESELLVAEDQQAQAEGHVSNEEGTVENAADPAAGMDCSIRLHALPYKTYTLTFLHV